MLPRVPKRGVTDAIDSGHAPAAFMHANRYYITPSIAPSLLCLALSVHPCVHPCQGRTFTSVAQPSSRSRRTASRAACKKGFFGQHAGKKKRSVPFARAEGGGTTGGTGRPHPNTGLLDGEKLAVLAPNASNAQDHASLYLYCTIPHPGRFYRRRMCRAQARTNLCKTRGATTRRHAPARAGHAIGMEIG